MPIPYEFNPAVAQYRIDMIKALRENGLDGKITPEIDEALGVVEDMAKDIMALYELVQSKSR